MDLIVAMLYPHSVFFDAEGAEWRWDLLTGYDRFGDASAAARVIVTSDKLPDKMHFDVYAYRRGSVGLILSVFYSEPDGPALSAVDLAQLTNARIPSLLGTDSPSTVQPVDCSDPWGCAVFAPGEPILLASAMALSGPAAGVGIDSLRGVEAAVADRVEILGHPVGVWALDSGCSSSGGGAASAAIVEDTRVIAVVGHSCTPSCWSAAPFYGEAHLAMVSPSCTGPSLTGPGREPSFFRTVHNDSLQGAAAAEFFFFELGLRTAATLVDESEYSQAVADAFEERFEKEGGTITARHKVKAGQADMRPVLTAIAADGPDLLFYPLFVAEGAALTRQARELPELENTTLAGADGMMTPDFVLAVGASGEGMYLAAPRLAFSGRAYDEMMAGYHNRYGPPLSLYHSHAYDATNLILNAIEEVGNLETDSTLIIGRQALRNAIASTTDHQGATGVLTCDDNGDCGAAGAMCMVQLQEGEFVTVWEP